MCVYTCPFLTGAERRPESLSKAGVDERHGSSRVRQNACMADPVLDHVTRGLRHQIVWQGEGWSHLLECRAG